MFDHVGIAVSDLAASERFYRTVLAVLDLDRAPRACPQR
jgi:catechol 2,3-dioxygenase-like lactoylglutathione lyase family enzyme